MGRFSDMLCMRACILMCKIVLSTWGMEFLGGGWYITSVPEIDSKREKEKSLYMVYICDIYICYICAAYAIFMLYMLYISYMLYVWYMWLMWYMIHMYLYIYIFVHIYIHVYGQIAFADPIKSEVVCCITY